MTTDEKAREIVDEIAWELCDTEGAFKLIATALHAARREGIEEAAKVAEDEMPRAQHRKKLAQMDAHTSEVFHQEGRWHAANDIAADIRALNEKAPTSGRDAGA